ncbi:MAG: UDP-N-acetylmuramate--L-alanine ligase [Crocinitomicaceae bacterium]|nr:UDP-N-acetylmuramate--L-alanine ligase [Crocinitomicaceae bacterium]
MNPFETNINRFDRAYFIGVGGIGMSALARYFNSLGWKVAGYDKTSTVLTETLESEGIDIHYEDLKNSIPAYFQNLEKTLVIYTPAIPSNLGELVHIKQKGFALFKRAQVLGMITRNSIAIGVAGTHGKTTTSTMLAHILDQTSYKCNAFLGGISTNFNSNFVSSTTSKYTVIEADEFDRSFLQLNPFASIITSTDADHLDIYGSNDTFQEGFENYVKLINSNGFLVRHKNVQLNHINTISYGLHDGADYLGMNLRFENSAFMFDVKTPKEKWNSVELGIPGIHNAENAISCIAVCLELGLKEKEIRNGLKKFAGVKRRFEYHIRREDLVYIDDYAHHPTEIKALISSVKLLYPKQKITAVFQPHLYSRTRDFMTEFCNELSSIDDLILLPIYPARENPIPGITSEKLLDKISNTECRVLNPTDAIEYVTNVTEGVIITIGAGDIDKIILPIKTKLQLR